MSNCLNEPAGLVMYDPEEHRETVRVIRKLQGANDGDEDEVITHQRAAELFCLTCDGYEAAMKRFDALCRGERIALMTRYEYRLHPADAEKVERNNAAARAEWEEAKRRALTVPFEGEVMTEGEVQKYEPFEVLHYKKRDEVLSWKAYQYALDKLNSRIGGPRRVEIARAKILADAAAFQESRRQPVGA